MESRLSGMSSSSSTLIAYVSSRNVTSSSTPVESMIPRSRKESSFDRPSPTCPKGKLSTTNRRSSCSTFGMRELLSEASDELVGHELGRENPDQRHVVLDPDGAAVAELCHQLVDGDRIEDAVVRDALWREQLLHVLEAGSAEEALSLGGSIGLLGPLPHGWRHQARRTALQQVFLVEDPHLQTRRDPRRELDHPVIQEGEPRLDRVRHRHPVALGRQDVTGQQGGGLQVLGLTETVPPRKACRQRVSQLRKAIVIADLRSGGVGKERLELRGERPSWKEVEELVARLVRSRAEESLQVGAGLRLEGAQVGIQPLQQQRPEPGLRTGRAEAPDLRLLEYVVAAEHL